MNRPTKDNSVFFVVLFFMLTDEDKAAQGVADGICKNRDSNRFYKI